MTQHRSERDFAPEARSPMRSRLAVGVTGAAVVLACVGYVVWSLSPGQPQAVESQFKGVALNTSDERPAVLQAPSTLDELDEIPLTLDDSADLKGLPVINAHLEVPSESDQDAPRSLVPLTTLRQLGYEANETPPDRTRTSAAWLTGTIEPSAAPNGDGTISRFLR